MKRTGIEPQQVFGAPVPASVLRARITFCPRCGSPCEEREFDGLTRSACRECNYIHFVNPASCVSVLIADAGRVLLGRRKPGSSQGRLWCMPCGFIEYNEDFITAARREVLEETGLEVQITGLISAVSNFFDSGLHTLVLVFAATPLGGELRTSDEMTGVGWFEPGDLPEMAFEADTHIIQRYFEAPFTGAPLDPRFIRDGARP
jgi:ADP-ribose pyrophosphatase YjhB (NUDIX family)